MKTPISDFKLTMNTLYDIPEGSEDLKSCGIELILSHEDLPIKIYRKLEFTDKFIRSQDSNYIQERVNIIIHRLYEELLVMADNNVCALPIEKSFGKYIYFPEWDVHERAWFILNPTGERCYTFKELISTS